MWFKRWLVNALEAACVLTHFWPLYYGGCRLSNLSADLDDRWGTGQWKVVDRDADG